MQQFYSIFCWPIYFLSLSTLGKKCLSLLSNFTILHRLVTNCISCLKTLFFPLKFLFNFKTLITLGLFSLPYKHTVLLILLEIRCDLRIEKAQ